MPITYIQDNELGRVRVNDFDGMLAKVSHPNSMVKDSIDTAVFFARELEFIKSRSYDVKYAELKFRQIFPISNEAGPGARSVTYRTYDETGVAEFIGAYAKDLPRADIGGKETTVPVRTMGISFGFTTQEIRSAAMTGLPLDSRKSGAAVRGVEQKHNEVSFFGDADRGLEGFFTHPNIPTGSVPNGAGGNPEWSTKTADEILLDLNACVNDIYTNTKMVERPNTLCLDPANRALIATLPRSANSDTTVLQYFVQNNEFIASEANVVALNECSAAVQNSKSLGNRNVMFAFRNDPDAMEVEIPMELLFHPEQREGLEIVVPGEASTAGINVYYPLSANICEDI